MSSIPKKIELDSMSLGNLVAYVQDALEKNRTLEDIAKNDFIGRDDKPVTSYKLRYHLAKAGYRYKQLGTLEPITQVEPIRGIPSRVRRRPVEV